MAERSVQSRLGKDFARGVRRFLWPSLACMTVLLAVAGHFVLYHFTSKAVAAHARVCAAGFVPASDGDLSFSIDRLLASVEQVAAVATLDSAGRLRTLHPDLPPYRRAASATLDHHGGPWRNTVTTNAQRQRLWGTVVILGDDASPTARQALFLIRDEPYVGLGSALLALLTIFVLGLGLVLDQAMTRWHRHRIASPFARLHHLIGTQSKEAAFGGSNRIQPRSPSGTSHDVFHDLFQYVTTSEARHQWAHRDADRKIRDREKRFHHRLRRAEDRATTDPLTRLRNRRFLEEELKRIIATDHEGDADVAVVVLDVDNFKTHNDTHGHQAGDELLRFVGELLHGSIRPHDHAIRIGGDEFLLVLPGVGESDACAIANRIVKMFGQWAASLEQTTSVSLSAGVASRQYQPYMDLLDLVAQADQALYAAKHAGKNTVGVL